MFREDPLFPSSGVFILPMNLFLILYIYDDWKECLVKFADLTSILWLFVIDSNKYRYIMAVSHINKGAIQNPEAIVSSSNVGILV